MMIDIPYDRAAVFAYAERWAFDRNPIYHDFHDIGGDCTNFASQCIYAGCGVMNYTPTFGWYFININDRSPSWTGVPYLYNFLIHNGGPGPYAKEVQRHQVEVGDIIQLANGLGTFYHSLVVVGKDGSNIYIATHTNDSFMRNLNEYRYAGIRYIHIIAARKEI